METDGSLPQTWKAHIGRPPYVCEGEIGDGFSRDVFPIIGLVRKEFNLSRVLA